MDANGNYVLTPYAWADFWAYQEYLEKRVDDLKKEAKELRSDVSTTIEIAEKAIENSEQCTQRNFTLQSDIIKKKAKRYHPFEVAVLGVLAIGAGITIGVVIE